MIVNITIIKITLIIGSFINSLSLAPILHSSKAFGDIGYSDLKELAGFWYCVIPGTHIVTALRENTKLVIPQF